MRLTFPSTRRLYQARPSNAHIFYQSFAVSSFFSSLLNEKRRNGGERQPKLQLRFLVVRKKKKVHVRWLEPNVHKYIELPKFEVSGNR